MAAPTSEESASASTTKTKVIVITVKPAARRPGHYDARLEDGCVIIRASRQPLLDAARVLINRGADPSLILEMWHDGAAHHALRAQLGYAAKLAVEERIIGGKPARFVPYRALNRAAVARKNAAKRQTIVRRRREVALRYDRARRRRDDAINFIDLMRLRDLVRFFHHRYGGLTLPDDDSGREDLAVALDHIVRRSDGALFSHRWVRSWAPWISESELKTMVEAAGRIWTATALGTHLVLTDEERTELKITTIAPCGLTEAEWKEIRKSRKRKRDRDTKRRKRAQVKAARRMPNSRELRVDSVRSLLSPDGISSGLLFDLVTIFPHFCALPRDSLRRAVNRIINDLANAKEVEISGPRNARLIREVPTSDD